MLRKVLWWGRFDPDYSRNRVLRAAFEHLGWEIVDYHPRLSALGGFGAEAFVGAVDLVWVPCFRQRDILAASRWARRHGIPVVFDPLISAYDKQVFERELLSVGSFRAKRLLQRERRQFQSADLLVADTQAHADYFADEFHVPTERLHVIPVGAEEAIFRPCHRLQRVAGEALEVLFYGTFIDLQGPQVIVEAAQRCRDENIVWTMLGAGPLLARCQELAAQFRLDNLRFEPWVSYPDLPQRICRADILLGVFGASGKAGRVIPNKVYQSLACGRPVITRTSTAYPRSLSTSLKAGLYQVDPDSPVALADAVIQLSASTETLLACGSAARNVYDQFFSSRAIHASLRSLLERFYP
jgi:glycosyltransferase involved in cell wall biosynthesis